MVSPFVNPPNSPSVRPSGSAAVIDMMVGPAFVPKSPSRGSEVSVETSDVSSLFLRFPSGRTVMVNTFGVGDSLPLESIAVMTRTEALVQEPT